MPNDAPDVWGQVAAPPMASRHTSVQFLSSHDFVDQLTEAIQLYADAVADHALCVEGHGDACEASSALGMARSRVRDLLQQIRR